MTPNEEAIQVLNEAKDKLLNIYNNNKIFCININTQFNLLINKVKFNGGIRHSFTTEENRPPVLIPQTEFMGEPIGNIEKIELNPKDEQIKIFRDKVAKLKESFPTLTNEQILESYKTEYNVVRGVAREAGLEDYKTGTIGVEFLENIRLGLSSQDDLKKNKEKAEEDITK